MPTLLLELFSEEIPSRMQKGAASQLSGLIMDPLKNAFAVSGVVFSPVPKQFVSPRHLAFQVANLPDRVPDYKEERRGPKIGAPEQALKGFLQSTGLTLEQCEQRDGYYYATIEKKGHAVAEVVKEICESALTSFVWPKSMHWGDRNARPIAWVRPLHRIVCLLDETIVPVQFGHLTASNITHGHRFLAPGEITIPHAENYESLLAGAHVLVDFTKRRAAIAEGIAAVAAEAKLALREDEGLLDEVTGLVEHPVPLLCEFDAKFLDLPPEVLISEMKNHQRYFALYGADGKLTNRFITVANMVNADGGARVKDGNSRVVRARLADGEFYWEQDRKVKLEDWGKKLSDVVFHAKVGMMDKKVERIEALALDITEGLARQPKASKDVLALCANDFALVRKAARLCKADLTSGMVGEFPELQGIMGRYYARHQGESDLVAEAIYEHYKPQGASDTVPESKLAAIISIADKIDSINMLFMAGEKPTGSKDPLALRRAALGVLRTILHHEWSFDLSTNKSLGDNRESVAFFKDRLSNVLRDEGVRHDAIDAALVKATIFNPLAIATSARELATWLETAAGKDALAAIKRSANILAAEEKKDKKKFAADVKGAKEPAEKAIASALAGSFKEPKDLESLTAPINAFFDAHLVNEDGKREARLSLLAAVRDAANSIADFSKLEG